MGAANRKKHTEARSFHWRKFLKTAVRCCCNDTFMLEQGSSTDGSLLDFEGRIATESLKKIQNKETQENSSREIWVLTIRIYRSSHQKSNRATHATANKDPFHQFFQSREKLATNRFQLIKHMYGIIVSFSLSPQTQDAENTGDPKVMGRGDQFFWLTVHPILGRLVMVRSPVRLLLQSLLTPEIHRAKKGIERKRPRHCALRHQRLNARVQTHSPVQRR
jgi:hypothetical protein